MAVSNNYEIKVYTLDGIAVQFAIPFDVNVDDYGDAINIVVNLGLTELEKGVDYTISEKTINYPDAVNHTGEKLTVFRRTPIEQPVDFVDNGNFTLEDIEIGLDRSIMIEQEVSANLDNTIKAQESAELAEQYKDIAIEKASDAEDWAVGTRSDGQTPAHSLESAKHYAESADSSATAASTSETNAGNSALESEGWAVGKQNGVDVGNTSPYYHNNSKYYSDYASSTVGAHSTALTYLDSYSANVDAVAGVASDVATVASNTTDISTVASNVTDVSTVASDITSVNTVAGNTTNIDAVAGNSTNINTVAGNATDINTVAGVSSDVTTVATNVSDINTVVTNLTGILAADDYASLSRQYDEGKKLDGTPVTSGEEGYENNAKYWADVASHYAVGTLVKIVRW